MCVRSPCGIADPQRAAWPLVRRGSEKMSFSCQCASMAVTILHLRVRDMNKAALVTGGAQRIGRRIVERLAAEGYAVAIHCRRSTEEAQAMAERIGAGGRQGRRRPGRPRRRGCRGAPGAGGRPRPRSPDASRQQCLRVRARRDRDAFAGALGPALRRQPACPGLPRPRLRAPAPRRRARAASSTSSTSASGS